MKRQRFAFTLVELLVTLLTISILLAIFAPALGRAREHGRLGACLSNTRQIGAGSAAYAFDHQESVPLYSVSGGIAAFQYGGKATSSYWNSTYDLTISDKPLNRYLFPGQAAADPGRVPDDQRMELPAYHCPSDQRSYQRTRGISFVEMSAYDDVGTSYPINIIPFRSQTGSGSPSTRTQRLQMLLRRMSVQYGSQFVIYLEDAASMGLWNQVETLGSHGKTYRHVVAFLDGHAAYTEMDTREGFGSDWMAVDRFSAPFD